MLGKRRLPVDIYKEETAGQSQKTVYVYFTSFAILCFGFAEQYSIDQLYISRKWHRLYKEAFKSRGFLLCLRRVDALI